MDPNAPMPSVRILSGRSDEADGVEVAEFMDMAIARVAVGCWGGCG